MGQCGGAAREQSSRRARAMPVKMLLHFHELKLISFLRCAGLNNTHRKFDHRVCRQANRHTPGSQIPHDLLYPALAVYIHGIDCELHEKHVDALAWHNPEPTSGLQLPVLQQTHPASRAAIGDIDPIAERRTPGQVPHI